MIERARIPRLLVCGFGHFPGVPENPAGLIAARLRREEWSPEGVETEYLVLPTTWESAYASLETRLAEAPADGVLAVGVAVGAEAFRVETRAHNRARTDLADAAGVCHAGAEISPAGPAVARATGPVEPMVLALERAGLAAWASPDAGEYLCNYTFYRLLTGPGAPQAAFLHIPPVSDAFGLDDLERGVRTAASAFARTLAEGQAAPAEMTN